MKMLFLVLAIAGLVAGHAWRGQPLPEAVGTIMPPCATPCTPWLAIAWDQAWANDTTIVREMIGGPGDCLLCGAERELLQAFEAFEAFGGSVGARRVPMVVQVFDPD